MTARLKLIRQLEVGRYRVDLDASAKKRGESPTISPGQPLSAEETEKVLGGK